MHRQRGLLFKRDLVRQLRKPCSCKGGRRGLESALATAPHPVPQEPLSAPTALARMLTAESASVPLPGSSSLGEMKWPPWGGTAMGLLFSGAEPDFLASFIHSFDTH